MGLLMVVLEILKKLSKKNKYLKFFHIQNASRGYSIKLGIKKSKYDLNAICAITMHGI